VIKLTTNLIKAAQQIRPKAPWCWLVKLVLDEQVDPLPTTVLRITDAESPITFPIDGAPTTFYPFPISFSEVEIDAGGNQPALTMNVSNATRELGPYLETGKGLVDKRANLWLVNREYLSDYRDAIPLELRVASATLDNRVLSLELRVAHYYERQIPQESVQATGCTALYKDGITCPYRGSLTSCNHDLADCIVHGNDMVANGYPRVLPMRIRAFPAASGSPA